MILTSKHEIPWTDEEPQTNPSADGYVCATDSLNRLTGLANTNSGSFGFGYDALGRRTSHDRPNGVNTSYTYDTLSRLLSVVHGLNLAGTTGYTYDAAGNRTSKTALRRSVAIPLRSCRNTATTTSTN